MNLDVTVRPQMEVGEAISIGEIIYEHFKNVIGDDKLAVKLTFEYLDKVTELTK
jgi:hypothetical protein